jgi:hypothetical protein
MMATPEASANSACGICFAGTAMISSSTLIADSTAWSWLVCAIATYVCKAKHDSDISSNRGHGSFIIFFLRIILSAG